MTYPQGPQGQGQPYPGGYDPNQGSPQPPAAPESGTSYSLEPPGQPSVDPHSTPPAPDPSWSQPDPYATAPHSGVPHSGPPDPYAAQQFSAPPGHPNYPGAWPPGVPPVPAPPAKKGMSVGLIAAIAVISLLVLAGLGVGIGYVVVSGDDDKPVATSTSAPPSAEPQKKKKKSSNDGGVENLVLEEDDVTDDLFPARLDGSRPPDYERIAHGKVSCDDATDSERLRKVFKEFGCEEVLVGAYVDEDKEVVVTIGYIKTDSKATAEKYHEECLDYRDKSMRPKMVVPKDSKIEKGYEAYYYTRATDEYITYTIVAYYDGRTPETIDTTMIQHSSAVAVRVEFDGRRP